MSRGMFKQVTLLPTKEDYKRAEARVRKHGFKNLESALARVITDLAAADAQQERLIWSPEEVRAAKGQQRELVHA